jgi:hypothetical protein
MGDRGWARVLLKWTWRGVHLEAEVSRARYFIRGDRHEAVAWAEVREPGGRYRVEVGSFRSVGDARAVCERDAERRCRRAAEERGGVDVRISRSARRGRGGLSTVGPGPGN